MTTVASSLTIVIGLFMGFVWLSRRAVGTKAGTVSPQVIQTLGRHSLNARQEVQLLRFGSKLLAVAVSPQATTTLAEITDPDEVQQITERCLANESQPTSASAHDAPNQFAMNARR